MPSLNIVEYKDKDKQYENKYIEYINALFSSNDGTANSLKNELVIINNELINNIKTFSEDVKAQETSRKEKETR